MYFDMIAIVSLVFAALWAGLFVLVCFIGYIIIEGWGGCFYSFFSLVRPFGSIAKACFAILFVDQAVIATSRVVGLGAGMMLSNNFLLLLSTHLATINVFGLMGMLLFVHLLIYTLVRMAWYLGVGAGLAKQYRGKRLPPEDHVGARVASGLLLGPISVRQNGLSRGEWRTLGGTALFNSLLDMIIWAHMLAMPRDPASLVVTFASID